MKKLVTAGIVLLLICACSSETERVIVKTYPDGNVELEHYYLFSGSDSVLIRETGYYPEGMKRIEGEYAESKREGRWTYWYDNGNKWSEARFKAGLQHGKNTVWHENGTKYYEGNYKSGERTGVWKFWDENGKLIKEVDYD